MSDDPRAPLSDEARRYVELCSEIHRRIAELEQPAGVLANAMSTVLSRIVAISASPAGTSEDEIDRAAREAYRRLADAQASMGEYVATRAPWSARSRWLIEEERSGRFTLGGLKVPGVRLQ